MLSLQTALKLSPETLHSALRNHLAMIARSSQSGHKPHTVYIIAHCRISSKQHCIFFWEDASSLERLTQAFKRMIFFGDLKSLNLKPSSCRLIYSVA